jgi:hypothetical protein
VSQFNKYLEIIQEMKVSYGLKDNVKRIIGMIKDHFNYNNKINVINSNDENFKSILSNQDNWIKRKISYIVFGVKYDDCVCFFKLSSYNIPTKNKELINNIYESLESIKIKNEDIDKIIIIPNEKIEKTKINKLNFNDIIK